MSHEPQAIRALRSGRIRLRPASRGPGAAADAPAISRDRLNPISVLYCFDDAGTLEVVLGEVTNTPWGERHLYAALRDDDGTVRTEFDKAFHVSPFMGLDQRCRWLISPPGGSLLVHMRSDGDARAFDATLRMRRREISAPSLNPSFLRRPAMTAKVVAAIYFEALRLKLKGARFHPHPGTTGGSRPELRGQGWTR